MVINDTSNHTEHAGKTLTLMINEKENWGEDTERLEQYDYRTFEGSLCGVHLSHMTVKMVRPGEDRERAQTTNTIHTKTQ